jgi:hypothetical protein
MVVCRVSDVGTPQAFNGTDAETGVINSHGTAIKTIAYPDYGDSKSIHGFASLALRKRSFSVSLVS